MRFEASQSEGEQKEKACSTMESLSNLTRRKEVRFRNMAITTVTREPPYPFLQISFFNYQLHGERKEKNLVTRVEIKSESDGESH